ncbi:isoleucine-tRNA ligase [Saguinus oedipus]|uniref:Isoleucine-tRNA ligase n=1 Tax=Saguinus oedipus TaxID=9490 RepID=A0ABQ9TPA3_SAGOE|nr:isoleucine-tRNA ligase [Saguinus oedipus]
MVRLAAELLLLLGLLLLTLHTTVLRGSGAADAAAGNASGAQLQNNLSVGSDATLETSFSLSKEASGEHLDHQAAHQPFPRLRFRQEMALFVAKRWPQILSPRSTKLSGSFQS